MLHYFRCHSCAAVHTILSLFILCLLSATALAGATHDKRQSSGDVYLVGAGKADITGPVVEIGML